MSTNLELLVGFFVTLISVSLIFPICYGVVMLSLFAVEWCVVSVARKLNIEEFSKENHVHIIQKLNSPISNNNLSQRDSHKRP